MYVKEISTLPQFSEFSPYRWIKFIEPSVLIETTPHEVPCVPKSARTGTAGLNAALTEPTFVSFVVVCTLRPCIWIVTLLPRATPTMAKPLKT